MDLKSAGNKVKNILSKYKYACLILLIGLSLLLIPEKKKEETKVFQEVNTEHYEIDARALSEILQSVEGAGHVQVMLSIASGEKTIYQTNKDTTTSGESISEKLETVITADAQRNDKGLINQVNPPKYLGAIVVCQGADSPTVKLAVLQAVSKITGLGADSICVLKMK